MSTRLPEDLGTACDGTLDWHEERITVAGARVERGLGGHRVVLRNVGRVSLCDRVGNHLGQQVGLDLAGPYLVSRVGPAE